MDRDSLRTAQEIRDAGIRRPYPMEASVLDERGRPVPQAQGWERHPQMRQQGARRLEPWREEEPEYGYDDPRQARRQDRQGDVNVNVSNDGRYYRTTKEELHVKLGTMAIDFIAWPFRLVKGFVETIVNGLAGLFGFVIKILILPAILFMGYGIYQSSRDRPAAETAQVVGKESVGVIGGLFKGIWDGMFGSDEPAAPKGDEPASDTAGKGKADR